MHLNAGDLRPEHRDDGSRGAAADTATGGISPLNLDQTSRILANSGPIGHAALSLSPWGWGEMGFPRPRWRVQALYLSKHPLVVSLVSSPMSALAPTPPDRLTDARGRPYFLWDEDMTLDEFRRRLQDPDPDVRAYFLGKLMRQAKPDDVFSFVTLDELREELDAVEPYLGRTKPFWRWLLEQWHGTGSGVR